MDGIHQKFFADVSAKAARKPTQGGTNHTRRGVKQQSAQNFEAIQKGQKPHNIKKQGLGRITGKGPRQGSSIDPSSANQGGKGLKNCERKKKNNVDSEKQKRGIERLGMTLCSERTLEGGKTGGGEQKKGE